MILAQLRIGRHNEALRRRLLQNLDSLFETEGMAANSRKDVESTTTSVL